MRCERPLLAIVAVYILLGPETLRAHFPRETLHFERPRAGAGPTASNWREMVRSEKLKQGQIVREQKEMLRCSVLAVGLVQIVRERKEMMDRRVVAIVSDLIAEGQKEMLHY